MPHALIGGTDTYFHCEGAPGAPGVPVLFVHGGVAGAEPRFRVLAADGTPRLTTPEGDLAALAERVRLVGYHRRGHGLSGPSPDGYALPDLAADAVALLDHLAIDRAAVVGHSLGGMVALQLALDHPARVDRLCLLATGAGLLAADDRFGRGNLARFYANVSADVALSRRDGLGAAFAARRDGLRRTTDRAPVGMAQWLASLPDESLCDMYAALLRDCEAFLDVDLTPRLAELRMPVAVVHGAADQWVPIAHGRHLHESIPHAHGVELAAAGHSNVLASAEGFAAVADFVTAGGVGITAAAAPAGAA